MALGEKLIKGSFWNGISQLGTQLFNLVLTVVLARLLSPHDFGLLGMITLITAFFTYFTDFGLTSSLIQRKDIDSDDENTVFWLSLFFSFLCYVICYFGAPVISDFYHEPQLTAVTRVCLIYFLVSPLGFLPETLERKKLSYKNITIAELVSIVISGVVTIIMACAGLGVWSLAWQAVIKSLVRSIILIFLTRWRPRLRIAIDHIGSLMRSGVDFTMNSILKYIAENIDYLLVSKLLGEIPMGLYTMSFRVSKHPISKLESIFVTMLFPAFSSFSDDKEKVRQSYFKILFFFLTWMTPLLIYGYFIADPLIQILLGPKWLEAIPLIKIFMVYLVFSSFCIQNPPIMIAMNKVRTTSAIQLVSMALLAVGGYLAIKYYGLQGMAWAFTLTSIVSMIVLFVLMQRTLGISLFRGLWTIRHHLARNLIVIAALAAITWGTGAITMNNWIRLVAPTLAIGAWYLIVNRKEARGVIEYLTKTLRQGATNESSAE